MLVPTPEIEAAVRDGDTPLDHLIIRSCILEWGRGQF